MNTSEEFYEDEPLEQALENFNNGRKVVSVTRYELAWETVEGDQFFAGCNSFDLAVNRFQELKDDSTVVCVELVCRGE